MTSWSFLLTDRNQVYLDIKTGQTWVKDNGKNTAEKLLTGTKPARSQTAHLEKCSRNKSSVLEKKFKEASVRRRIDLEFFPKSKTAFGKDEVGFHPAACIACEGIPNKGKTMKRYDKMFRKIFTIVISIIVLASFAQPMRAQEPVQEGSWHNEVNVLQNTCDSFSVQVVVPYNPIVKMWINGQQVNPDPVKPYIVSRMWEITNTATITGFVWWNPWILNPYSIQIIRPDCPSIMLDVKTNGYDARYITDTDIPVLMAGDTVTWTYQVTNTGNTKLVKVWVLDIPAGDIVQNLNLDRGETTIFTKTGIATTGIYTNEVGVIGTVEDTTDISVQAMDISHYWGVQMNEPPIQHFLYLPEIRK